MQHTHSKATLYSDTITLHTLACTTYTFTCRSRGSITLPVTFRCIVLFNFYFILTSKGKLANLFVTMVQFYLISCINMFVLVQDHECIGRSGTPSVEELLPVSSHHSELCCLNTLHLKPPSPGLETQPGGL